MNKKVFTITSLLVMFFIYSKIISKNELHQAVSNPEFKYKVPKKYTHTEENPTSRYEDYKVYEAKIIMDEIKARIKDINKKNKNGNTPLFLAFTKGFNKILKYVEKFGKKRQINIEDWEQDVYKIPPKKQTQVIEFLVKKGANVNTKYKDGNTPLIKAINIGNPKIVKLIVYKGANIMVKKDGKTALQISKTLLKRYEKKCKSTIKVSGFSHLKNPFREYMKKSKYREKDFFKFFYYKEIVRFLKKTQIYRKLYGKKLYIKPLQISEKIREIPKKFIKK
ncbi:ankyrin repeat domain-containing protein [Candidatus Babeliales bacterium]|nr:ankyrin repeat domain-containing protein [Candidatus Babeliales bacterium]